MPSPGWDEAILRGVNGALADLPGLTQLWAFIDAPAGAIVLALCLAAYCHRKRNWRLFAVLIGTAIVADLLASQVLKPLLARPRPCFDLAELLVPYGCGGAFSLPSGHATTSFAIAGVVNRPWMWAIAALSALSRVAIGVHYPSDVLAGAALGALLGWIGRSVAVSRPA